MTSDPPNDWADGTRGPYNLDELAFRCALVRSIASPESCHRSAIADGSMYEALDSAERVLQKVPLTIKRCTSSTARSQHPERHENIEGFPALRDFVPANGIPERCQSCLEGIAAIIRYIKHMKKSQADTVKSNLVTFEDDIAAKSLLITGVEVFQRDYFNFDTRDASITCRSLGTTGTTRYAGWGQFKNGSPVAKVQCAPSEIQSRQYMGQCINSTDDLRKLTSCRCMSVGLGR